MKQSLNLKCLLLKISFNEAIVESKVSSLEDIEVTKSPSRPQNICKIEFHINKWPIGQSSLSKGLSDSTFRKRLVLYPFK